MIRRSVIALMLAFVWGHADAQAADAQMGTWVATPNNPAILLGDGFPATFYRVCLGEGAPIKIRYVTETDKAREADIRLPGSCTDLKAKRIDVTVQGADGVKASGTYRQLPNR